MADKKISQLTGATTPLAGTEVLPIVQSGSTVKVSVDNLTKGKTVNATTFDTDVAAAAVTLSGTSLAADGTDTNIDINITPKGTGEVNLTKVDIDAGAIDGTTIGANSAAAGTFTSATISTGDVNISTAKKGITFTSGGYIASQKGQITSTGPSTDTLVTLDNVNENRAYWISVRQSGAAQNMVVGFVTTYGASGGVLQIAQSNTNPVVLQTLSFSGLELQLTIGSGYGSTTWDWVLTRTS